MTRSRKKLPIFGHAKNCDTEKGDKRQANRSLRSQLRSAMARDAEILPIIRNVSNVWAFGKDGKFYSHNFEDEDMRK